jgi:hypothetical protein
MSDRPTPRDLEAERQKLLGSARAEQPDAAKKAAGLDALVAGDVRPLDFEPPALAPKRPARWPWLAAAVALALALWWWLSREPAVVPGLPQPPAFVVDAGAAATVPQPPPLPPARPVEPVAPDVVDASVPPPEPASVDAGVVRVKPLPSEEVDTLAAELALLDGARTLLETDAARSLATLNRYAKRFPNGSLKLEADVVRVEALFKAGRRHEGLALVDKLRKRDSGGLLEERLRRLIPDAG